MEKLIKVTEAKQLAYAMFPDPILRTAATRLLDDAPAADAVPVVHGRWKEMAFGEYFICSNCEFLTDWRLSKYCPNCGAKMD